MPAIRNGRQVICVCIIEDKQLYAEHSAAKDPDTDSTNTVDKILDETLGRLGALDSKHPLWKSALNELGGTIIRPDLFKTTPLVYLSEGPECSHRPRPKEMAFQ
ncbi:hypothetical protein WH357_11505 [Enterobacter ludwigii]